MFSPARTPNKLPSEVKSKCRTKIELNRQKAIYEMIHTEKSFIEDIELILDIVIPLMCSNVGEAAAEVAGNLADLLYSHKRISEIWEDAAADQGYIINPAYLFHQSLQYLEPHIAYTQHFTTVTSAKLRRPEIMDFSRYLATLSYTGGLGLDGHLIKPIQRVTKYRLMLREIKKSSYDDDPEIDLLDEVDAKYGELLNKVDSGGAQMDAAAVGRKIQGFDQIKRCATSRFIREGALTLCNNSRKAPISMNWFLFSDVLIICKQATARLSAQAKCRPKFHFPTTRTLLFPRSGKHPWSSGSDFQLELVPIGAEKDYSDQGFLFTCQSEDEKRAWINAFQFAVETHTKEEGFNFCTLPKKESSAVRFLRPISSLMIQNEKRVEVGEFTPTSMLRSLSVTPETMEDNCEIVVSTTEDYAPKTKHEIGFYKHTLLRIVNCDDKQYLKVSMGNVQGLVHRSRIEERNDISRERLDHILVALRAKPAACWIKNWAYCLTRSESALSRSYAQKYKRASANYLKIMGSQGDDEFEFDNENAEEDMEKSSQSQNDTNTPQNVSEKYAGLKTPRFSPNDPFGVQSANEMYIFDSKYATDIVGMKGWQKIEKPGCKAFYYCKTDRKSYWCLPDSEGRISQESLII